MAKWGTALGTGLGGVAGAFLGGPAGAAVGASLGGSLGGAVDQFSSGGRTPGRKYLDKARQEFDAIQQPKFDTNRPTFGGYQKPDYTPIQAGQAQAAARPYQSGGQGKEAQLAALKQLQDLSQKGFTADDRANYMQRINDLRRQAAVTNRGLEQGLMQRGLTGSGLGMGQMIVQSQGLGDQIARTGQEEANAARERSSQAMLAAGQLGGSIRGQDYQEGEAIASAMDAINKFNIGNRFDQDKYNTELKNKLTEYNNSLSDKSYDRDLEFQKYLNSLSQQGFSNNMGLAGAKSGIWGKISDDAIMKDAQDKQAIGAVLEALGAYGLKKLG